MFLPFVPRAVFVVIVLIDEPSLVSSNPYFAVLDQSRVLHAEPDLLLVKLRLALVSRLVILTLVFFHRSCWELLLFL